MSDDTRYTSLAGFGSRPETGIAIDMAQVPSKDEPKGSRLRSTGEGYSLDDGARVAHVDNVGPESEES